MVNYLARFSPRLSKVNAPLRQLLKQDSEFAWDANHDRAFQQMKDLITQHPGPVLAYFDPQKKLRLQVDASKNGLGAVMLQVWRAQVHTVLSSVPVSDKRLTEIQEATTQDPQLAALRKATLAGWPDAKKRFPPSIQEYWNHRDELSEIDGILFKGDKIIVPRKLRENMLERIHAGHMGVEKSKNRARDLLFWPGMGKRVEAAVEACSICQERRSTKPKEPMLSHAIPERPRQVIGTDLFTWNSQDYLVIVDYYSRFVELERLYSCTSSAVTTKLKAAPAMAQHGIAESVISENGACYSLGEFRHFTETWGFTHTTTSPHYPQSNGLAEKTVQTAKRILYKAKAENKDPYLSLLEYRNTPVDNLKSQAQLLMSWRLRLILPATAKQLQPQVTCQQTVHKRREVCQHRQQAYYNRSARPLPHLPVGVPMDPGNP
ncbi:hypothetical protein SKAU_G00037200 [Synaphobranchus kaupii]|uniref:Gypsy retrotransposon integrase-like protein 1 n=1 Tax=Synaphobranchus kaupii TaxID=118154 RepID=A0A9Q1GFH2_SYNKA|nr:hypothetical protein SKAU_G00037200 [Synaphobranchus kaupii]